MSSLSDLTNTGNPEPIPGYILSKPGLSQIGEAEEHFAKRYVATMSASASILPHKVAVDVMAGVSADVRISFSPSGDNSPSTDIPAETLP